MELISVIMPVYNIKSFDIISQSIKSILNQSYKNFEFIICDDGSNDDTFCYIKKFEKIDDRIKIIKNNKNFGLSYSLNRCIAASKGLYIARMDADDISLPDRLEKQYKYLKKNSSLDFVGSYSYLLRSLNTEVIGINKVPITPNKKNFLFGTPFIHPTLMIKKNIYSSLGGYNCDENVLLVEDYEFFMRAYYHNYKGANIPEPLIKYRTSENRRKYKYRLNEIKIQLKWFSLLKLLPIGYLFIIKTLLADFIPFKLRKFIKNSYENFN